MFILIYVYIKLEIIEKYLLILSTAYIVRHKSIMFYMINIFISDDDLDAFFVSLSILCKRYYLTKNKELLITNHMVSFNAENEY